MRSKLLASALVAGLTIPAATVALGEPPNDGRDDAAQIPRLPVLVAGTTKDARAGAADSSPCADTAGSVWYRLDPGRSRRVVVRLAAGGDLDATLDVYL